jgi:hypothetical protein
MANNTWPGGNRHAMTQDKHAAHNAASYPGTRQICAICEQPTGRCEDDELYADDAGPLCEDCYSSRA